MLPIVNKRTMQESDRTTILAGTPSRELMLRAAKGIFDSYAWSGKTLIVCGVGNNAGDGYALATLMQQADLSCELLLLCDRFSEDGQYYFEACKEKGIPYTLWSGSFDFSPYHQIVDCIFGIGFRGTPDKATAALIDAINKSEKIVISADINSGLDADNGLGTPCVRSDLTVAIQSYKPGHFLTKAKDVIGAYTAVEVGIQTPEEDIFLLEEQDVAALFAPRKHYAHKGNYGYVAVMGGSVEYAGAAKLANMSAAALRAGCGVATLAVPDAIVGAVAPHLLESTLLPIPSDEYGKMTFAPDILDSILSRYASLAVGMGWGRSESYQKILSYLIQHAHQPLIIDADGLNTLSTMDLNLLKDAKAPIILTPHQMEFSRLSGLSIQEIEADPIAHAKAFAKEYGIILLLKGCCTVVTDGEVSYLSERGSAGMATAGSGDVLSGVLAGLCGYLPPDALTVASGA
ncbi:MAG: NAD(P)H-hydrate dehydratase, partial [Clostridia bacterium]|nr:NAD(P)H-hydrate dehydratase [Clostridia bacterium]